MLLNPEFEKKTFLFTQSGKFGKLHEHENCH